MAEKRLQSEKMTLLKQKFNLQCHADNRLKEEQFKIRQVKQSVKHLDPQNVLKRGYAIVYEQGKAVTNVTGLRLGTTLTTRLFSGEIETIVTNINAES